MVLPKYHLLRFAGSSSRQIAFPAVQEGAVLDGFATGKGVRGEILGAQIGSDFAVATNLEIVRQMSALADQRDADVEPRRLQPVRRHIVTVANLTLFADDHLLIRDGVINAAASADDGVEEQDGIAHDRALLDDNAWGKHAMLDAPFDDAAVRDQAIHHLRPFADMGRRTLLATRMNDPGGIVQIEGGAITEQRHMG